MRLRLLDCRRTGKAAVSAALRARRRKGEPTSPEVAPLKKCRLCGRESQRLVRTTSSRADDVPRLTTVVVWDARLYAEVWG